MGKPVSIKGSVSVGPGMRHVRRMYSGVHAVRLVYFQWNVMEIYSGKSVLKKYIRHHNKNNILL